MGNLENIKSDKGMLDALKSSAKTKMTAQEIEIQRASFVYASMATESITKSEVENILTEVK